MRHVLAALVLLLSAACAPGLPTDAAVLRGMAEGLDQSAQATGAAGLIERTRQAQWTLAAYEWRATEIAGEAAVIGTLSAATQAAQHGRATDAAQMVADAQAAGTATAITGAAQATATERVVQATAQADDDARRREAVSAWSDTLIWFARAMLALIGGILLWLLWRVAKARGDRAEAEARRAATWDTPGGWGQMLPDGTFRLLIPAAAGMPRDITPPPRMVEAEAHTDMQQFVMRAVQASPDGWRSKTIPRWDRMQIGAAQWHRQVSRLKLDDLVRTLPSGTYVREGHDLAWLWARLPSPTAGQVIDVA